MAIQLTSSSFTEGQPIPEKFTCLGKDTSPELRWQGIPEGTKSLALIMEDPDAPNGLWVHWVLWNLAATETGLSEGVPPKADLPNGARQGMNDFKLFGYGGPCPPPGKPHRYIFILYALGATLSLKSGSTRQELLEAMKGRILAEGRLMGLFKRP